MYVFYHRISIFFHRMYVFFHGIYVFFHGIYVFFQEISTFFQRIDILDLFDNIVLTRGLSPLLQQKFLVSEQVYSMRNILYSRTLIQMESKRF